MMHWKGNFHLAKVTFVIKVFVACNYCITIREE